MINVTINNRRLRVWFNYTKTYHVDVPREGWQEGLRTLLKGLTGDERKAARRDYSKQYPRFERVERPLTICYIGEKQGEDKSANIIILAKAESKLYFKDRKFALKSVEMEALRQRLMAEAMSRSGLSKDERQCLWDAFHTRFAKRPHIRIKPPGGGAPASPSMPITHVAPPADSIPVGRRLMVTPKFIERPIAVVNKVVAIGREWNYPTGSHKIH